MRRTAALSLLVASFLAGAVLAPPAFAAPGGAPFAMDLTGAAEIPGPGDPDGSGTAELRINPGLEEVCFTLTATRIAPAIAAHIHVGDATVAGPVVIGLTPPTSGTSTDCVSADRELLLDILQNPENYYVNVHTTEFPAGAIRGQLSR